MFIRFDRIHERGGRTGRQTDGRTDRHHITAKATAKTVSNVIHAYLSALRVSLQ